MGGSVNITLRKPDGEVVRMCRWTNIVTHFTLHPGLYAKTKDYVDELVERHQKMRDDYEKNKNTGKFRFDMTSEYGPQAPLAPYGYGLIVIDMQKNVILDCQGYSNTANVPASAFSPSGNPDEHAQAAALFKSGLLQKLCYRNLKNGRQREIATDGLTFEQMCKVVFSKVTGKADSDGLPYPLKNEIITAPISGGFAHFKFKESEAGYAEMMAKLVDLGFEMTPDDNKAWDAWLSRQRANERDDARTSPASASRPKP